MFVHFTCFFFSLLGLVWVAETVFSCNSLPKLAFEFFWSHSKNDAFIHGVIIKRNSKADFGSFTFFITIGVSGDAGQCVHIIFFFYLYLEASSELLKSNYSVNGFSSENWNAYYRRDFLWFWCQFCVRKMVLWLSKSLSWVMDIIDLGAKRFEAQIESETFSKVNQSLVMHKHDFRMRWIRINIKWNVIFLRHSAHTHTLHVHIVQTDQSNWQLSVKTSVHGLMLFVFVCITFCHWHAVHSNDFYGSIFNLCINFRHHLIHLVRIWFFIRLLLHALITNLNCSTTTCLMLFTLINYTKKQLIHHFVPSIIIDQNMQFV